jgi:iron complex outermembrane recepter protein
MTHLPYLPLSISILTLLAPLSQISAQPVNAPHEHDHIPLDEVIVTAPLDRPLYQQAQAASILAGEALNLSNEPSLGQTLSRMPGVSSSFYGPAASRPIIRGLDGDRIRILQNGLNTLDASSASPDHGVSFDVSNLKSIEVVRGPATLLYGSNAIGGVVNAIDGRIVDEKLAAGTVRGAMGGRYSSVDNGYQSNFMIEGGLGGGFAFHLEGFTRAAEDFRVPGELRSKAVQERTPLAPDELELRDVALNTYLRSEGLTGGLSYVWDEGYIGFAISEYHSRYGSPAEPDVMIDMNQTRYDLRGAFYKPFPLIKEISYRFAWSDYEHTEFEAGQDNTVFKTDGYDARIEMKHEKIAGLEGVIGFQSDRTDFFISGEEAFMPPTITQSNSLFFFEELTAHEKLRFQFGGRYDHISIEAVNSDVFGPARQRNFDNVSASTGLVFTPTDAYSAALTLSYAERAPTHQELFANGVHAATGTFEIGNQDLGVESSLGIDLNLRKRTGWITGSLSGYYNRFQGFIGLFPTGNVVLTPDGDLFDEFAYRAVPAEFLGAELEATFHLLHPLENTPEDQTKTNLHWEVRADAVRARNAETGASLPRTPPFHISNALVFQRGGFTARLEGIYAAPQDRIAANEIRTDSYFLVNASLNYHFKLGRTECDVFVRGLNLTDEVAREHTAFLKDTLPLPGRGIVIGMRSTF